MSVPPNVESSSAPPLPPAARAPSNRARAAGIAATAIVAVVVGGAAGYVGGQEAGSGGAAASPTLASSPGGEMNVPAVLAGVEPAGVTGNTAPGGGSGTRQAGAPRGSGTRVVVRAGRRIASHTHLRASSHGNTASP